jgi:hypothetical protein
LWSLVTSLSLWRGVVNHMPNPQPGGPPLVSCPWLLIQYIHSYLPYLEAVSYIHNLRAHHAVVTMDPHNMAWQTTHCIIPATSFNSFSYKCIFLNFK